MPALMKISSLHQIPIRQGGKKKRRRIHHKRSSLVHFHEGSHFVRNPLIKITDADMKHRRVRCTHEWRVKEKKEKKRKSHQIFFSDAERFRAEKPCKRGEHGTLSPGILTPRVLSSPTRRIPMRRPRPRRHPRGDFRLAWNASEYDPRLRYDRAARV